jgi:hypothetical protein
MQTRPFDRQYFPFEACFNKLRVLQASVFSLAAGKKTVGQIEKET